MQVIKVGELYVPGVTRWPECAEYRYTKAGHELRMFFNSPSAKEVTAARKGPMEFALFTDGSGHFFFLYKFNNIWSDAPFLSQRVPEPDRAEAPVPHDNERATLLVTLVDAGTGIVQALRQLTFSPAFSRHLHALIRRQFDPDFKPETHDAFIQETYRRFPSSEGMVRFAKVKCKGGD